MIPRYILGNWWSRYWEYSQDELQSLMQEFREREIPLSVCIVDMDWHITKTGNTSDGWTGYTWNRELFPDPPGFIRWLHEQGLRTALNLHPARGIHPHEEQYEAMAKWMGVDPASREPIPFDITDPRFVEGYIELLHHPYEEMGVDFWWMDWQQGRKSRVPGLDPLWWINHLHFYDLGRDGRKRPFVFSRWGGPRQPPLSDRFLRATPLSVGARWPSSLISPPRLPTSVMAGGVTTSAGTCSRTAHLSSTCAGCSSVCSAPSFGCTQQRKQRSTAVRGANPSVFMRLRKMPCSSGMR